MTVWKPISTAPRDGRDIAIRGGIGPYGLTSWEGVAHWAKPINRWPTWQAASGATLELAGYVPTEWRPLVDGELKREDQP